MLLLPQRLCLPLQARQLRFCSSTNRRRLLLLLPLLLPSTLLPAPL
jgi:hypothetical protein